MKKNSLTIGMFIFMSLLLVSCAESANLSRCDPYGFWGGLWHGIIVLFDWIGSLFNDDIAIYAINNNGGWYDFGFMLGMGCFVGGTSIVTITPVKE